jgi:uncharacterized protein YndB with AHSA1/START domain
MPRTDTASLLISAPASRIFRAFSEPGCMERWLPPQGMTGEMLEFDFRAGGHFLLRLRYLDPRQAQGKTTGDTDEARVRILEIVPDERIGQVVTFESDDPRFAGEMKATWQFKATQGGTLVEVRCENVPDGISAQDHADGLNSTLANLARFAR